MPNYHHIKQTNLRKFRKWAHRVSPRFGHNVDALINQGAQFGDFITPDSIDSSVNSLVTGLDQAAIDAQLSAQNYYQAMSNVEQMQRANAMGMNMPNFGSPIGTNISPYTGLPTPVATGGIFGIPIVVWLILAGVIVVAETR